MQRKFNTVTKFIKRGSELIAVDIPKYLEEEFTKLALASAVKDPENPFVGEDRFKKWIDQAGAVRSSFSKEFAI